MESQINSLIYQWLTILILLTSFGDRPALRIISDESPRFVNCRQLSRLQLRSVESRSEGPVAPVVRSQGSQVEGSVLTYLAIQPSAGLVTIAIFVRRAYSKLCPFFNIRKRLKLRGQIQSNSSLPVSSFPCGKFMLDYDTTDILYR